MVLLLEVLSGCVVVDNSSEDVEDDEAEAEDDDDEDSSVEGSTAVIFDHNSHDLSYYRFPTFITHL